jgi:hypothetical protein
MISASKDSGWSRHAVNAGKKMHRRAGVKMHHRWWGPRMRSFKQGRAELSFPVRLMSLLSRPDLALPWPRRAA